MRTWIKICGLCCEEDVERAIEAGVSALGFNLVEASKRFVDQDRARALIERVGGRARTILVVADRSYEALVQLRIALGADFLQLHGDEPPELVGRLGAGAFKAIAIADAADTARAAEYPGELLLVDTKVSGQLGGTGLTFDHHLVSELARSRRLVLAGGLTPGNVAIRVRELRPFGVDVASGVEGHDPRRKDEKKVRAFVAAVRAADSERAGAGPESL